MDSDSGASEGIAGRVAVVVGAAGGIGRAVALRLARAECQLALVDCDADAVQELAVELGSRVKAVALCCDITERAQVESVAQQVAEQFGAVHILVNSAGINTRERTLADMPAEDWDRVVGVNLSGVFHCIQAFLGIMRRSGGAVVVNIVSTAARLVSPGAGTHYCAAKRGLVSLTESVNIEEGRNGIRACAICPGEVATALVSQRPEPPGPARLAQMLQPEDVAEAVHYAVTQPTRVTVSELVIFPSAQISGVNVI